MKTLMVAMFSLVMVCMCSATLEGASATIPLFVWSDNQIFSNNHILDTITEEDIENSLYSLLGIGGKKGFISNVKSVPEVVVLFVEPQLQTDQIPHFGSAYTTTTNGGSFSALKRRLDTSKSSLVAPYATAGISFSLLDTLLNRVADKAPLVLAREADSALFHELSRNSNVRAIAIKDLNGLPDIFTNGKAELIVVCLENAGTADQFAAHGEIVDYVSQLTSAATSGNFVGMYTGNSAPSKILWTFPNPNAALFEQPSFGTWEIQVGNTTGNSTGPHTYFTGAMLEVFMVVIALLTMVFVGVCNICSLQVPETFEAPKPQQKIL